jgi:hypothetical protein
MQSRDEQSHERPRIEHALILFETADLRIAVPNLNSELALCEFLAFAQYLRSSPKVENFSGETAGAPKVFSFAISITWTGMFWGIFGELWQVLKQIRC